MYIQGMAWQTQVFLLCAGFGFALGAVYDILRFIRRSFFPYKKAVYVQDIIFSVISTVSAFFFLLCVNDCEFRAYSYTGMLLGFTVYYFTLSVITRYIFDKISAFIGMITRSVFNYVRRFFVKTIKFIKKRINKPEKTLEKQICDSV